MCESSTRMNLKIASTLLQLYTRHTSVFVLVETLNTIVSWCQHLRTAALHMSAGGKIMTWLLFKELKTDMYVSRILFTYVIAV